MADLKNGSAQEAVNGRFTVDADYLKQQAGEAFWTFIAPVLAIVLLALSRRVPRCRDVGIAVVWSFC